MHAQIPLPNLIGGFVGIPQHRIETVIQRGYTLPALEVKLTQLGASLLSSVSPQERRSLGWLIRGLVSVVHRPRESDLAIFPHDISPPSIRIRVAAIFNLLFDPRSTALLVPAVTPMLAERIANQLRSLVRSLQTPSDVVDAIVHAAHQRLPVSQSLVQQVQTDPDLLKACARSCWYRMGWVPSTMTDVLIQQIDLVAQMLEQGVLLPPLITAATREPRAAARVLCAGITNADLIMSASRDAQMVSVTVQYRPDLEAIMRISAPRHQG